MESEQENQDAGQADEAVAVGQEPTEPELANEPNLAEQAQAFVEQLAGRSQAFVDELVVRSEELAERSADLVDAVQEIIELATTISEVYEILWKPEVLVREPDCVRCMRLQGEPHKLGSCTATARVYEARDRLDLQFAGRSAVRSG
jgi:hypothetical protein